MKIQFCDLCNESVPQSDLDAGRARFVKGRVVCSSCERAMSLGMPSAGARAEGGATADPLPAPIPGEALPAAAPGNLPPVALWSPPPQQQQQPTQPPPSPAAAPRSSSIGLWVAVLGLLATAGVVFVFQRRIDELVVAENGLVLRASQHEQELSRLKTNLRASIDDQIGTEKRWKLELERQAERFQSLADALAKSSQAADHAREELQQTLAHLREDLHQGAVSGEQRLDELSHRIAQGEDAQRDLREKLSDFQKSAEDARKAVELAAKSAPAPAPAPENAPAWQAALSNLSSDNPSLRWEAVDALGRSKDAGAIPHVTPMLRDTDLFVRMCAARVLGDLGTLQGVAALIDSLEDAEVPVRETAWNALRSLTGKDIKFDPQANEAERQKRVKQWREWWKKEGEGLLEGGAGGGAGDGGGAEGKSTPPQLKSGTQKS